GEGTVYFINRYRRSNANLRTQFLRIIRNKAGVQPWKRLWQNLRSSRETELTDEFPAHVVTSWIGNTERVASAHYLQVTHAHFDRALIKKTIAYNTAQNGAEPSMHRECTELETAENAGFSRESSTSSVLVRSRT